MKQFKIGNSWIRGVVGNGLTAEVAVDFACSFGTYVDGRPVVVARDTRRSSPLFASAVVSGLLSTGSSVVNLGVCPTPVAQYVVRRRKAAGGIVITGSHNDASWNALKFVNAQGALLSGFEGEELLDLYHAKVFRHVPWQELGTEEVVDPPYEEYLRETVGRLGCELIRSSHFRVAFDAGNGTAGRVLEDFCGLLGCRKIVINDETQGDFARGPAPCPRNMRQLAALLRHVEADIGFVVNTDVDRVGIVTEKGVPLSEEYTFPLVARHVLQKEGEVVVTTYSTSRMIDTVAGEKKARVVRTKIGEGNVLSRSVNEGALVGGEGSGGVAYLPVVRGFDGFVVMALILQYMATQQKPISELAASLPCFVMRKGEIPSPPDRVYYALEDIRHVYRNEQLILSDGVLVSLPGMWLHVRASTTEPLLRVIVEGEDPSQVDRLFECTLSRVNAVVHGKS